jgi:quinol monooxygenase YgiN
MKIRNIFTTFLLFFLCCGNISAQDNNQMVRLAKLVIDSAQLDSCKALLKEEIETSVRVEPGALTLYALSKKDHPTHFTILEIYADTAACKAHLQTPHFIKYKNNTKGMVKPLELIPVNPLLPGLKIK